MEIRESMEVKITKAQWIQFIALVFGAFMAIEAMAFQAPVILLLLPILKFQHIWLA